MVGVHDVGVYSCPECDASIPEDCGHCSSCGWEQKTEAEEYLDELMQSSEHESDRVYKGEFHDSVAGSLAADPRVEIVDVEKGEFGLDFGTMKLSYRLHPDTDEWPSCPVCGGILNFSGECPSGHRMSELEPEDWIHVFESEG